MPLTGTLGTAYSQPGSIQPGYFYAGKAARWRGPGGMDAPAGGAIPGGEYQVGAAFAPPGAVASQMAASDPTWWEFH